MSDLKYKVGDKVRIKSLDWYNENKDEKGNVIIHVKHFCGCMIANAKLSFTKSMTEFCGKVMTIEKVFDVNYIMKESRRDKWGVVLDYFSDEMIEGLVEDEIANVMDENKMLIGWIKEPNRYRLVPDKDYEIKYDEKGFFYLEKKKTEYPKTYEECCELLGGCSYNIVFDRCETSYEEFLHNKLFALRKLIICRDAYWKIAGEEMGLGKSWEPDWNDVKQDTYGLYNEVKYTIINPAIFVFPTEEMRDAFYENFKELIKICKELL